MARAPAGPCRRPGARRAPDRRRRWPGTRRCACSSTGRRRCGRASPSPPRTRAAVARGLRAGWTGSPWPSSWPPPGCACSRRRQLLARLEDRFRLLTGGGRTAPARQQTLRAAVDWSYALLARRSGRSSRRLAVFAGGWTLEAAEAVGRRATAVEAGRRARPAHPPGGPVAGGGRGAARRHGPLPAAGDAAPVRPGAARGRRARRGARARAARRPLPGAGRARPSRSTTGRAQIAWLDRLEREHDNLRAALRWFVDAGDAARGTRLAAALRRFWWVRGHTGEARAWTAALVDLARRDQGRGATGRRRWRGRSRAPPCSRTCRATTRRSGRWRGRRWPCCRRLGDRRTLAEALHLLGHHYLDPGTDHAAARAQFEESAAHYRAVGDDWGLGWSLHCLATSVWELGDAAAAGGPTRRARGCSARSATTTWPPTRSAPWAPWPSTAASARGRARCWRRAWPSSAPRATATTWPWSCAARGDLACEAGDAGAAHRAYRESLTVAAELGRATRSPPRWRASPSLAAAQAQPERALRLAGAAAALREATGQPRRRADGAPPRAARSRGARPRARRPGPRAGGVAARAPDDHGAGRRRRAGGARPGRGRRA